MPIQGFTVGRDIALDYVAADGPKRFSKITGFQSKQETSEVKIKGLDGSITNIRYFEGWSGSYEIERQDGTVDAYFAQLEANYFQGLSETPATITETIAEAGGAVTVWRYTGVISILADAGDKRSDSTVKMKIEFKASRRIAA